MVIRQGVAQLHQELRKMAKQKLPENMMTQEEIYRCLDEKKQWYVVSTMRIKHRVFEFKTVEEALAYAQQRITKKNNRDIITVYRSNQRLEFLIFHDASRIVEMDTRNQTFHDAGPRVVQ